ncbi:hypothetical protein [Noviherbaspirillum suwonense]|uniref:Uncharacterized protein n=1 Tax=Noviherbaspirillum suwonense TaxID=1224511 RepID=A0ABY1PTM9_9BURK|nr:hypothetical protein [Noviherbaspirillum suwonense]SMP47373.1 hypothetical protein SAMN06295970_10222 [Noviherbaspirillum suwonense]
MFDAGSATRPKSISSLTDSHKSSPTGPVPPAPTTQAMIIQQLRAASRPPHDRASYDLPDLAAAQTTRLAEIEVRLDAERAACRYEPSEKAVELLGEHHRLLLMATRETVQDFFDTGRCPEADIERKALALFLLNNKLLGALTWLVAQSDPPTLDLGHADLLDQHAGMIAEWATSLPFMIRLDLSGNRIDAAGVRFLASALKANTIAALNLGANPLGAEGMQAVCEAMLDNSSMLSLGLSSVGAGSAGVRAVAVILGIHPSLSTLSISDMRFDDAAAAILADALAHNKTLVSVVMRHLDASDAGLSMLVSALKTNTALKSMTIFGLGFEQQRLPLALAEALAVNRTLTHFEGNLQSLTSEAGQRLAEAVDRNTALLAFGCGMSFYESNKEAAVFDKRIQDKVMANGLIEAGGNVLADPGRRV